MSKQSNSRGFIILSIANFGSKILSLLYIPILLKIIGGEAYGTYYAATNIYAFMFMVTISGTTSAIPKLMAEYIATGHEKDAQKSFTLSFKLLLAFSFVMAAILYFSANALAKFTGYDNATLGIIILSPSLIFTAVSSGLRSYFQGRNNLKPLAISQFIEQFGNVIFSLLFAYLLMNKGLEYGVAGANSGTTLGALISALYLCVHYKKDRKVKRKSKERITTNNEILKYVIKFSAPLILSTFVLYAFNNVIDVANIKSGLLAAGFSDSNATIRYGNFGNYIQLMSVPMIIISALSVSIIPTICANNSKNDKVALIDSIKNAFKTCFSVAIPSAIGLCILSRPIFNVLFTSENAQGSTIMKIGALVLVFNAGFQITTTTMNSLGRVYIGTATSILGSILKVLCNLALVRMATINIYGAVVGLFLAYSIPMLINHKILQNHLKTKESLLDVWKKPLVASVVMGISIYVINLLIQNLNNVISNPRLFNILPTSYCIDMLSVGLCVYIGGLIYLHTLVKLKGIYEDDLSVVPRKVRKLLFL